MYEPMGNIAEFLNCAFSQLFFLFCLFPRLIFRLPSSKFFPSSQLYYGAFPPEGAVRFASVQ